MCVCVCSTCWPQLNRTSVILHVTRLLVRLVTCVCVCVCSTCWSQLNRTSVILHVTRLLVRLVTCVCVCVFYMLVTVKPNVCYITRDSTSCEASHVYVCVCSTCWSQLNRTSVILHVTRLLVRLVTCVCVTCWSKLNRTSVIIHVTRSCEASHVYVCVCSTCWSQLNRTSVILHVTRLLVRLVTCVCVFVLHAGHS